MRLELVNEGVRNLLALTFAFAILTLWIPAQWPVAVFQLAIFLLASAAVASWIRNAPRFAYPFVPLVFVVIWGALQLVTGATANSFATQYALVNWLTMLAVFALGYTFFQHGPVREWFREAMIWFSTGVAIVAILQVFTAGGKIFWYFPAAFSGSHHVMGPILYHNHYAAFVEVVLPIAVWEAVSRQRNALRYSVAAAILYSSVIVSASRAGTALATAEIVLVGLLVWRANGAGTRATFPAFVKLGALLCVVIAIAGWGSLSLRFGEANPFGMRREFAMSSLQMIASHPLTGVGLGNWPIVYPGYAVCDFGVFANQAHSDWLEWTAEGGIPFGIAMLTLFLWVIRPAVQTIWGIGVIAVFLHASVYYPFSRPAIGAWITIVIAMLAAIYCHSDGNSVTNSTKRSYRVLFS